MMPKVDVFRVVLLCAGALLLTACGSKQPAAVSFSAEIKPILEKNCLECHQSGGAGLQASGLSMESYEALMKGTRLGPVIKPGDSISSTLVLLITGVADQSIRMPHGDRQPLSPEQVELIKRWIAQGAANN